MCDQSIQRVNTEKRSIKHGESSSGVTKQCAYQSPPGTRMQWPSLIPNAKEYDWDLASDTRSNHGAAMGSEESEDPSNSFLSLIVRLSKSTYVAVGRSDV